MIKNEIPEHYSELRTIRRDLSHHADFHTYAVCEVMFDKNNRYITHSDPYEISELTREDLVARVEEVVEALVKDVLYESELLNGTYNRSLVTSGL